MNTLPPYVINVYNRASQSRIGSYHSNQVPQRGDQVSFYGHRIEGDPFNLWGRWKVDEVVWTVSSAGSMNALNLIRTHGSHGEAACLHVELHVWPADGPFFAEDSAWVKACSPPDDEDDDVAAVSVSAATQEEQA